MSSTNHKDLCILCNLLHNKAKYILSTFSCFTPLHYTEVLLNTTCQNYCLISSHLKAFLSFSSFFHLLILPFTWTHFNILTTLNLPPANHCALKTQIKSDGKIILENSDTEEFMFSNLNIPEWEGFK